MDYGSIDDVRALTGLTGEDITDDDLAVLMDYARRKVFMDVLVSVEREKITPLTATRLVYQLEHYPLGSLETGVNPTPADVKVESMSLTPGWDMWNMLTVEAIDAEHGLIKLAETPPSGVELFASYHYFPTRIERRDLDEAVNYYTAHLATLRLEDPGTIAIPDLVSNALVYKENKPTRFLEVYRAKIDAMTGGLTFGVVIP